MQQGEDSRLVEIWNRVAKKKYVSKDEAVRISIVAVEARVSEERVRQMLQRRQKRRYDNWRGYNPPAWSDNLFDRLLGDFI